MMETSFFLFSYIESTEDFILLEISNLDQLKMKQITSFTISQQCSCFCIGLWNDEYQMELFRYTNTRPAIDPSKLLPVVPYIEPQTIRSVSCTGSLDTLHLSQKHIEADGWLLFSQDPPRLPDQVYMMAHTQKGTLLINTSKQERSDVATLFRIPHFSKSGFVSSSFLSEDSYQFSVGYRVGDQVFQCTNLQKNLDAAQ